MIAEDFIARLQRVRKSGERQWSAQCPAHEDKGPSLRVTDVDGKILIHCFAGCGAAEVVAALGVQLHDLFPPRNPIEHAHYRRERYVKGTLQELRHELQVALIILGDTALPEHRARAGKARTTIGKILRELNGAT